MAESGSSELTSARGPGRRRAATGLIVLAWCAVVAVAATAGWLVVDRAGVSLLGGAGPGRSGGVGAGGGATASATASSGPTGSLGTAGGRVTATCTPDGAVSLSSAIPAPGWRVEHTPGGPKTLTVEFKRNGRTIEVQATCVGGRAVVTLDSGAAGASGGSGGASAPASARPSVSTAPDDHGGGGSGGGSGGGGSGWRLGRLGRLRQGQRLGWRLGPERLGRRQPLAPRAYRQRCVSRRERVALGRRRGAGRSRRPRNGLTRMLRHAAVWMAAIRAMVGRTPT